MGGKNKRSGGLFKVPSGGGKRMGGKLCGINTREKQVFSRDACKSVPFQPVGPTGYMAHFLGIERGGKDKEEGTIFAFWGTKVSLREAH